VLLVGHAGRRQRGRGGLEQAAYFPHLEQLMIAQQVRDEGDRFEQQPWIEARHKGSVALARLEDLDHRQRAHRLAQRVSRETQLAREVLFARQPLTRNELPGCDHVLDAREWPRR